tara:strand:+ start:1577 stop:5875 length:4299 start_codon:yes stop_codon:yes gene_type:complete
MSSKNKTRKNRKAKSNNTTRKAWKRDARKIVFRINQVDILDKNDDKKVRFEQLKEGVTKFLPENKPGDIRRQFPKGKDNWKPEDAIKFDYLLNKYNKQSNYTLTPEDTRNINKLLGKQGIRDDEDTPTPEEVSVKEQKEEIQQPEPEPEPQPEPQPEPESVKVTEKKEPNTPEDLEEDEKEPTIIDNLDSDNACKLILKDENSNLKNKTTRRKVLKCLEEKNRQDFIESKDSSNLYPNIIDPNFTKKLTQKKEFLDTKLYSKKHLIQNLEEEADKLCNPNFEFELEPHQMFIKNFMSFQTPYNSLLVFHGLGTGKTCSAIGVAEEMRSYYKQLGINKKILIVATPNVQKNFELQLFDKRKLKNINGLWNIKACSGSKFIKEINPMNVKNLSEEKVLKQIKKIIKRSYEFIGYIEFANQINRVVQDKTDKSKMAKKIKEKFSDRLIIIDEVHNIRTQDNIAGDENQKSRRTIKNFLDLVTYADNMKLLLLTATPMFNNAEEIIWLTNLMNLNDKRFPIKIGDVFKKGNFVEGGRELLINKLTGYVSYLSGENPFTFPYRIFPKYANSPESLINLQQTEWNYPTKQINNGNITDSNKIKYLDLFMTDLSTEQQQIYDFIVKMLKKKHAVLNQEKSGIPYTIVDGPLQSLNICYPHEKLVDNPDLDENIVKYFYGKNGLERIMQYTKSKKKNFRYVKSIQDKFGRIFSSEGDENSPLRKYSSKMYSIIKRIKESEGIVIIYSNYIDGGCVPMALALEEAGITRYGNTSSLFKTPPVSNFKVNGENAKYIMITGDKDLSPRTETELAAATSSLNTNGEKVKVVIISRAGSEGLDFKNIRQIHILEPWYNLNRIDQIIGRGVRNKSHCSLPFTKRTVEIFLYGTKLNDPSIEAIDLYVYRKAEHKSIKIGKITRLLKENSIDCLLNKTQQEFNADVMNKNVELTLSNNNVINFDVGHKSNSIICDFMNCDYSCFPNDDDLDSLEANTLTYNKNFIIMNLEKILQRIRNLFKEHYIYDKEVLIKSIEVTGKRYSREQIDIALDTLINDKSEILVDMLGNPGRLINIDNFYAFQPNNIDDIHIPTLQRKRPVDVKNKNVTVNLSKIERKVLKNKVKSQNNSKILSNLYSNYENLLNPQKSPKKIWTNNAAWAIVNLVNYNKLDKDKLVDYALLHLFEILKLEDKIILLNSLYQDNEISQQFKDRMKRILEVFVIEEGGNKAFAMADFRKSINKQGYIFLVFDNETNKWIVENNWKSDSVKRIIIKVIRNVRLVQGSDKGFVPKQGKINNFDNEIGFIGKGTGNKIVLKTKHIGSTGRVNKGVVCPSAGVPKSTTIFSINKLNKLVSPDKGNKYNTTVSGSKMTVHAIYDDDEPFSRKNINYKDIEPKNRKPNSITDTQFCIEKELLLRYLDENQDEGKRWFFNSFETQLNELPNLKVSL